MKAATHAILLAIAMLLSGCSNMRTIKVTLIDSTTKSPVSQATVATGYSPAPYSLASCRQSVAVSGPSGTVEIQANYLDTQPTLYGYTRQQLAPFICVESQDFLYTEYWPALNYERKEIIIELTPRGDEPRHPDDLWIQPTFLRRLGSDIKDSWHRLTSRPGGCTNFCFSP